MMLTALLVIAFMMLADYTYHVLVRSDDCITPCLCVTGLFSIFWAILRINGAT